MFNQSEPSHTLAGASIEILTILLGAFILGMMLGWLLKSTAVREISHGAGMGYSQNKKKKKKKQKEKESKAKKDDILLIEGIGPKIALLLEENGISTFHDIVEADVMGLEEILSHAGGKFKAHNPTTWPDQARLARDDQWTEFEEYQEILQKIKKRKK